MKTVALFAALFVGVTAYAQDPVKTSPQYYKVLVENDQVRVFEYHLKPGEKEPMHSHSAGVIYWLTGAKLRITFPDGKTQERVVATGETIWRDPVTLAVGNIGKTEAHAIAVDLKSSAQRSFFGGFFSL
jgi:quercetin dioxygenase-like cupin family protein